MARPSRRSWLRAALAAAAGLASPLLAQPPWAPTLGTRIARPSPAEIPTDPHLSDTDRAELVIDSFATCVVKRSRTAVEHALALPSLASEGQASLAALATPECLANATLHIPQPVMRGALFVALYRMDFGRAEPILSADPVDYAKDVANGPSDPDARGYLAIRQFGDCVARADPADVRALVLAAPGSGSEQTALQQLNPKLATCLSTGSTLTFSKSMLVGTLAETLYRMSRRA